MKTQLFILPLLLLTVSAASAEEKGATKLMNFDRTDTGRKEAPTFSSLDRPDAGSGQELLPKGAFKFENAEVLQVLRIYEELSGRTVIRSSALPMAKISIQSATPLSRCETLQALDTVLAENGITMVLMGRKFVKAVPSPQAATEAAPLIDLAPELLPESSSYMMYIFQLKNREVGEVLPALQPFASKMPNSIVGIKEGRLLILRDYSANIRRMLQVLERLEKPSPERR